LAEKGREALWWLKTNGPSVESALLCATIALPLQIIDALELKHERTLSALPQMDRLSSRKAVLMNLSDHSFPALLTRVQALHKDVRRGVVRPLGRESEHFGKRGKVCPLKRVIVHGDLSSTCFTTHGSLLQAASQAKRWKLSRYYGNPYKEQKGSRPIVPAYLLRKRLPKPLLCLPEPSLSWLS
jgi:hypothetical protein